MVGKAYDWSNGAILEDHTKKKHFILEQYFEQYLKVRCSIPQQERFRLIVVDGFSGAGLYRCGSYGSPLIFLETLNRVTKEIVLGREQQGLKPVDIDCLLILNDRDSDVVSQLRRNIAPFQVAASENPNLSVKVEYFNHSFRDFYPKLKTRLGSMKCSNILFNLDQCGHSNVTYSEIADIMLSWRRPEIIFTFMVQSLLAFLSPNKEKGGSPLDARVRKEIDSLLADDSLLSKPEWLGAAEKIVFEHFKGCATFVSPFSINNPGGWQYWLMHFSHSYRARQVYNNILHADQDTQVHHGKSGLQMLSYDPASEGQLYLFNSESRMQALDHLTCDIPRLIASSGDALSVSEFYQEAYNDTPAHSEDIDQAIINSPEVEVVTANNGTRRKANAIRPDDTLKLVDQKSFFFTFD